MESKKGAAALLCCLLPLMLVLSSEAARLGQAQWLCTQPSKDFKGDCVVGPCCTACRGEGFAYGKCQQNNCNCFKPCFAQGGSPSVSSP